MVAIDEDVFLPDLNKVFTYSISNSLNEIINAIFTKTGINIVKIEDSDWKKNTRLAKETRNMMKKHNVSYSMTTWIENNDLHLVINRCIDGVYFLYSGQTMGGRFFTSDQVESLLTEYILRQHKDIK